MHPGGLFVVLDGCSALIPKDFREFLRFWGCYHQPRKNNRRQENLRRVREL